MFLKLYFIALPVFLGIDALWLGFIAKDLYSKHLGYLMTKTPNWLAAIIFYLLFVVGLVFFVLTPAIDKKSRMFALLAGSLFGLISYATYDLTNLATVKDWPVLITVIDLIWGTFLSASVSLVSFWIATKIGL